MSKRWTRDDEGEEFLGSSWDDDSQAVDNLLQNKDGGQLSKNNELDVTTVDWV